MTRTGTLRLKAETAEDLSVISACLQDAVTVVADLAYVPSRRSFAAIFSRFRWEAEAHDHRQQRIIAGLHFDNVLEVQSQNFPQSEEKHILDLLTIGCEEHDDAAATITLVFADGAAIKLKVECIEAYLRDVGEPWPTPRMPKHPVPEADAG
ncbi:MAG: DUF2948 family protein [Sphingomonadales bacterium]